MSFGHYLVSSKIVLVDRVGTFKRMIVASLTTSSFVTTTIQLRNTPSTKITTSIKHLNLIFFNELNNILSLINYHCIFRFSANWVDTFKWKNVKLQTSKLSKNGSNRKGCFSSTKCMWSSMMLHQSSYGKASTLINSVNLG